MTTFKQIISIKQELRNNKDLYIKYLENVIKILLRSADGERKRKTYDLKNKENIQINKN